MTHAASGIDEEHLDENALARHVGGEGTDAERARVASHIDGCDGCRALLAALVRTLVAPDAEEPSHRLLPRGTNLGRYVLLDPVGRGGMGMVYGAFDPELDRKVAVKFLRGREGNRAGSRTQLLAEAQAIARLSHPNIVTVHDVGTFDGEVFFAMEYVKGETLRRAQRPGISGLRHTLALYGAAGQGLAAAHQAGIVHGDFKPENVLVGEDGRVRVTDFGLARAVHEHAPRFAGTPTYMAPEHWHGHSGDVRSDQYSFCVALLEAVEGRRPEEVSEASPTQPPEPISLRRRTLPVQLARVLARGLALDPAQRWPSMDALLEALREASLPFRRSTGALAAALVVVTAVVWGQHAVWERRVDHELAASAARLPALLHAQIERVDLLVQAGLRAEGVMGALGDASNLDAALGLAEDASREQQLAEAHRTLSSADLPGLRSRDALLVANAWGRVVLDLAAPEAFGAPVPALPLLTQAMEGVPTDALWSSATLARLGLPLVNTTRPDDLLLVSARPVVRGSSIIGLVLTGRWVDTGLLDELGRAAGAKVVLHAPDGGWAGARWSKAPPLGRAVQLQLAGTTLRVFGVRLGAEGTRTPAGDAYVVRLLTPGETGGAGSPWVRWGLLVSTVAVLGWLGLLTRRSGWSLRSPSRD
ncbi:MAG: serine/threonine-protein kinase [Myxococcaceae bacterium]